MPRQSPIRRGAVMRDRCIVACVAAALMAGGCATSIPETNDSATPPGGGSTAAAAVPTAATAGPQGPPGLPGKTDAKQVQGAPFKIPAITLNTGAAIVTMERKVKADIAAVCPGCATVVVREGTDTTRSRCQLSGYDGGKPDPDDSESATPSVVVEPGAQIILYTGTLDPIQSPCDEDPEHFYPATTSSEPDTTEPDTTEPGTTEPGTTEQGTTATEPGTTEPTVPDPSTAPPIVPPTEGSSGATPTE
ncbi:hypothetical protein [Nocardia sp. NPDC060249]|uniref:hypothetical protein n=1 Tax=Nocardia sp. NPDC060249 TaxID=3347082 RepID=UPI003652E7AC